MAGVDFSRIHFHGLRYICILDAKARNVSSFLWPVEEDEVEVGVRPVLATFSATEKKELYRI